MITAQMICEDVLLLESTQPRLMGLTASAYNTRFSLYNLTEEDADNIIKALVDFKASLKKELKEKIS